MGQQQTVIQEQCVCGVKLTFIYPAGVLGTITCKCLFVYRLSSTGEIVNVGQARVPVVRKKGSKT